MDATRWERLTDTESFDLPATREVDLVNLLKRRTTFIKYKNTGRSYSRLYYLILSEDAVHYRGSRHPNKREACFVRDIDQIRPGFTTNVWRKCLQKGKITGDKVHLAFSILYHNNRHSLDLLADSEAVRSQWIRGLEYLVARHRSHIRTHREITDRWIWHLFSQADVDRSGHLNRQEVRRLLHTLNIEMSDQEMNEYFDQANIRLKTRQELDHLDKDEFLIFYKYVSQRPELLEIICQFNGSSSEQTTATLSDYKTIHRLPAIASIRRNRPSRSLSLRKRKSSRRQSASIAPDGKNYLTIEQLKTFLQEEQKIKAVSIEDCAKLIARFEPSIEGRQCEEIGVDGLRLLLLHDEFCLMDPDKSHRIYHDMTQPINNYFIATSHNTYLQGNQIFGDCTPETYIHALRTGCRAVEMDCYDGEDLEPIVYHGKTLTVPISFRDVITAIATVAFTASPYPLFLNIENHCSHYQQGVMARHLRNIFGDHLLTEPLQKDFDTLPSPEQLKYKVLVRSRLHRSSKLPAGSVDEPARNPKECHPDFANLIIYAQIISFTNVTHVVSTQKCHNTLSFDETKASDLIALESPLHLDVIALTQQHLVRIYPGGRRQDSSNLRPFLYWPYGAQMVALNYQADDESMWLQHGFFSDNGGCGYLLKPPFLLAKDRSFDPKQTLFKQGKHLQIHLISGQHLPKKRNSIDNADISDPYVRIATYGIGSDCTEYCTPSVRNNGLNPIWDCTVSIDVHFPELCLVSFHVLDKDRVGRSNFLGQACLPFHALESGYRHVKLKGRNGDYIHGTLFLHVKIEDF